MLARPTSPMGRIFCKFIIAQTFEKEKHFSEKTFAKNGSLPTILREKGAVKMENLDPNTEQQVWQRVFACKEAPPDSSLRAMELAAMELAGFWRQLAGMLTGKQKELARQLYEGEQANLAALRGIGVLSGSREEVLKLWSPSREMAGKLLEKGYHKTRRCMVDYMGRSAEPEFGVVFRTLADREGRHCTLIAELLGMNGKHQGSFRES